MIKTLLNVFINNSSEPFSNNICIGGSNTWCHALYNCHILSCVKYNQIVILLLYRLLWEI